MKYINHIVSCFMAVMAFALVGCDLDENPKSEASESMIFSSESGLKTLLLVFLSCVAGSLVGFAYG